MNRSERPTNDGDDDKMPEVDRVDDWFAAKSDGPDEDTTIYEVRPAGKTVRYHVDKEPMQPLPDESPRRQTASA